MGKYKVYLVLVFVMLLWGLNVSATKILVTEFAPVTMTSFRIFTAGVSVLLYLSLSKTIRKLTRKEFLFITFVGLFNVVGHHFFISLGFQKTSATNGGLIIALGPIINTVMAIIFLGTRLNIVKSIGIVLGLFGAILIVLKGNGDVGGDSLGDLFVLVSLIIQAVSYVFIKKAAADIDGRLMTGWMLVTGSIILFCISLIMEPHGLGTMASGNISDWLIFLGSAVLATGLGHSIYNQAVQHIGSAETAIFSNLSPFFALVGSSMFLGETMHFQQVIGFALIIAGVISGSGILEKLMVSKRKQINISA